MRQDWLESRRSEREREGDREEEIVLSVFDGLDKDAREMFERQDEAWRSLG